MKQFDIPNGLTIIYSNGGKLKRIAWLKIGLAISFLVLCILSGCKKAAPHPSVSFLSDGLAYVQFNQGKYFIYRDSATNKTDSVVVTESSIQPITVSGFGSSSFTGQSYTLTLSNIDSGKVTEWLTGTATALSPNSNIDLFGTGYLFRYPACNCQGGTQLQGYLIERSIPSMVVEGKVYSDVVLTSNYTSPTNQYTYYWAKGTGLIKRINIDASDTASYTLLRTN